jgi:hypothetical protein
VVVAEGIEAELCNVEEELGLVFVVGWLEGGEVAEDVGGA